MKKVKPYKLIKNVLNQGLRIIIIYKNLIYCYLFFIIYIPKLEKSAKTGTGR